MKQAEITVGHEYITTVSGVSRRVRVLGTKQDYYSGRTKFEVQTVRDGKILPKYRSAAALHAAPERNPVVENLAKMCPELPLPHPNACGTCEECVADHKCAYLCQSV
jgi:hypothetical protein